MSTSVDWLRRALDRVGITLRSATDERATDADQSDQSSDAAIRGPSGDPGRADERDRSTGVGAPSPELQSLGAAAERIKYSGESRQTDVDLVETAIASRDRERRKLATETIGSVPGDRLSAPSDVVAALVETLETGDLVLSIGAARALAQLAPAIPQTIVAVAPELAAHVDAYNVWVSDNVTAALRVAARTAPAEVAPHVYQFVDADRTTSSERNTLQNAVSIVHAAGETAPATIEPAVPRLRAILEQSTATPLAVLETIGAVAEMAPTQVAPAIPALAECANERTGAPAHVAMEAIARIASADPSLARSAVPTMANYLTDSAAKRPVAIASSLVTIVEAYPDERETILSHLSESDGFGRLRAARALAATDTDTGRALAEETLEGSALRLFLPHSPDELED